MGKNVKFEINPLDINLAKIQHNLIKQLQNNKLANYIQKYENYDKTLNFEKLEITLEVKNEKIALKANIAGLSCEAKTLLFEGNKEAFEKYLAQKTFFETCKSKILNL